MWVWLSGSLVEERLLVPRSLVEERLFVSIPLVADMALASMLLVAGDAALVLELVLVLRSGVLVLDSLCVELFPHPTSKVAAHVAAQSEIIVFMI